MSASAERDARRRAHRASRGVAVSLASLVAIAAVLAVAGSGGAGALVFDLLGRAVELRLPFFKLQTLYQRQPEYFKKEKTWI